MSKILTKEMIVAAEDLTRELVEVPEWRGSVYVRVLTGTEQNAYQEGQVRWRGDKGTPDMRDHSARLAAMAVCDEKGNRLFTDQEFLVLGKKSFTALDRIVKAAERINKMIDADPEDDAGK